MNLRRSQKPDSINGPFDTAILYLVGLELSQNTTRVVVVPLPFSFLEDFWRICGMTLQLPDICRIQLCKDNWYKNWCCLPCKFVHQWTLAPMSAATPLNSNQNKTAFGWDKQVTSRVLRKTDNCQGSMRKLKLVPSCWGSTCYTETSPVWLYQLSHS